MLKSGICWENDAVDGIQVEDLDEESFNIFRRESIRAQRMTREDLNISNADLLDSLNLLKDGRLTRAAVLLFHRTPDKWIPGCYTIIGKGADLQYQDEVHGSLFMQAERAIDLIYLKYLKAVITCDHMTRVETYPFPKEAVKEAYYNALVHSDKAAGTPIQIRIDDDAMYISNDCVFPAGWTAETLLVRHQSKPYNPAIANAFLRAGFIEGWGIGIQKICDSCEDSGTSLPEITVHPEDIMLKLTALDISGQESLEKRILEILADTPVIRQTEIAARAGIDVASVQRIMKRMSDWQTIERKPAPDWGSSC